MVIASWSLWASVVAVGAWHGLNPAMGWPLAVARGLERRRAGAVFATWLPLGAGHLAAMALVLAPFAMLAWMLAYGRELRLAAGALVVLFGLWRLVRPGHPRWLARVRPTQVAWWSFLMATAHGAALMLLPLLLGLCRTMPAATSGTTRVDHAAVMQSMSSSLGVALAVSFVHTLAMIATGLAVAWCVYRFLGLRALRSAWINLDAAWAIALMVSGLAAMVMAWAPA